MFILFTQDFIQGKRPQEGILPLFLLAGQAGSDHGFIEFCWEEWSGHPEQWLPNFLKNGNFHEVLQVEAQYRSG